MGDVKIQRDICASVFRPAEKCGGVCGSYGYQQMVPKEKLIKAAMIKVSHVKCKVYYGPDCL